MIINLNDKIETPRFMIVRIAAIFENSELAENCGFIEPTHFRDEDYHIRGKSIGLNKMVFAAIKRD